MSDVLVLAQGLSKLYSLGKRRCNTLRHMLDWSMRETGAPESGCSPKLA